jgi:bifunctional N-acetylglucosamine-1-phosphate-uridyltransferase/glucosamine-1-phosphate-acetyltransferase GlmU-like protein
MYDAIILVGGNATRLQKPGQPFRIKSFQIIDNKPVILHILDNILKTEVKNIYIVYNKHYANYHFELITKHINNRKIIYFIKQNEILGTLHAVKLVYKKYQNILLDKIIIFYGDLPFLTNSNIENSLEKMNNKNYCGAINIYDDIKNSQHAKIIFDENNEMKSVIEYKSYKGKKELEKLTKCGGGLFAIKKQMLSVLLNNMKLNLNLNEYSLFGLIEIAYNLGYYFTSHEINSEEVIGVDDDEKLKMARAIYDEKIKFKV